MSDDTEQKTHVETKPKTPIGSLMGAVRYLGVGALVHAALLTPTFKSESLWSWGYLLAWPIPLAWFVLTWIGWLLSLLFWAVLWIGLVLCIIWACLEAWKQVQVFRRNAAEANRYDERDEAARGLRED